jgi:hypothetical protein
MKLLMAALLLCLTTLPAHANKCAALAPTNTQNIDDGFKEEIDGELKGILGKLTGGTLNIDGEYRKIETDELRGYPDANKLYVWQSIIYLACVGHDLNVNINELVTLYFNGPSGNSNTGIFKVLVCTGQFEYNCPGPHNLFYTCRYMPSDEEIADKVCARGPPKVLRLKTIGGNKCGYALIEVTCNQ